MDEFRDVAKEARKRAREEKRLAERACPHRWREASARLKRKGVVDQCVDCELVFPCVEDCRHLDCAEVNDELDLMAEFHGCSVFDGPKVLYDYMEEYV